MRPRGVTPGAGAKAGSEVDDLGRLAGLARDLATATTAQEALDVAHRLALAGLGVGRATLVLTRPDGLLEVSALVGAAPIPVPAPLRVADDHPLARAARRGRAIVVPVGGPPTERPDPPPAAPGPGDGGPVASLALPLVAGAQPVGSLELVLAPPRPLSAREASLLDGVAAAVALACHGLSPRPAALPQPATLPDPAAGTRGAAQAPARSRTTSLVAYLVAVAVPVGAGALLATTSDPSELLPGGWFLVPVVLAAVLGGLGPAVVASVVSAAVLWWVVVPPSGQAKVDQPASLAGAAGFVVGAVVVAVLVDRLERSRRAADAARAHERAARDELDRVLRMGAFGVVSGQGDRITTANDAFLAMVGRTHQEVAAGLRWSEMTAPEWAHVDAEIGRELRASGVSKPAEKEALRPDGSRVPLLVSATLVDLEEGRWSALVADLTERRRLEEVLREVETARATAEITARLAREHLVVEALQRAVLPERLPVLAGVELAACYVPAHPDSPIGGDWYDAVPLDDDRVVLIVGDVAGHGLGSVSVMGQLRNALRAFALEGRAPDDALRALNGFVRHLDLGTFATVIIGTYHRREGRLAWTRAGHPPPVRFGPGGAEVLEGGGGPLLGAYADPSFPVREDVLGVGDGVLLYTDGLVERRATSFDEGLGALVAELGRCSSDVADDICTGLVARVLPQHRREDDLCQLVVRRLA